LQISYDAKFNACLENASLSSSIDIKRRWVSDRFPC